MKAGEEVFCSYDYKLDDAPPWYQDLWSNRICKLYKQQKVFWYLVIHILEIKEIYFILKTNIKKPHKEEQSSSFLPSQCLKVRQIRNDFFKPTFLPKNERTNSTLQHFDLFSFFFWKKVKTPKRHFKINWPLDNCFNFNKFWVK